MMFLKNNGLLLATSLLWGTASAQVEYECDPCVDRSTTKIQAIVFATSYDPFFKQAEAGMRQASKDMNVEFDIVYAEEDYETMAVSIEGLASESQALIVTLPEDDSVLAAVQQAIDSGTPVFGFERGYDSASSLDMPFVGFDDSLAGRKAAESFGPVNSVLFLQDDSPQETNIHSKRLQGLKDGFASANGTAPTVTGEVVKKDDDASSSLAQLLDGCSYEAILISSEELIEPSLDALEQLNCVGSTLLGAIGASSTIHQAVSRGELAFALADQPYLQGASSIVHAALYVSTGKKLAQSSESESGMLLTGPELLTQDKALTDTLQNCQADGFPVCPNDKGLDGITKSSCDCADRRKLKIAGVLHAVTTDAFWDIVYTAANQAADDFGVSLELDRMEPDSADVLHFRMATQIEKLCQEGIDGIFVTIPSDAVLDAIKLCQDLNVPVVSINAGPDFSRDMGLQHHLGMVEFNAGYLAGKLMFASGQVQKALCLDHAPGNIVLIDRCGGFEKAAEEMGIPYLGQVTVPDDNANLYVDNVETFIADQNNNEWNDIGILLGGTPQHIPGLLLKDKHPEILIGSFDTSEELYVGLNDGRMLFGMDQGPYLQGYLPIPLLAWQAQTEQNFVSHLIETGPEFVTESPSKAKVTCEQSHFKTCDWIDKSTSSGTDVVPSTNTSGGSSNDNTALIIALVVVAAIFVLAIGFLAYRMHLLKKYIHRLEEEGRSPPPLSRADYVSSLYKSVNEIVGHTEKQDDDDEIVEASTKQPC